MERNINQGYAYQEKNLEASNSLKNITFKKLSFEYFQFFFRNIRNRMREKEEEEKKPPLNSVSTKWIRMKE